MTSSKYDKLVKSLADLDVALVDMNGEYRATYDIMADIAAKWDSMSSMEQAALADAIAGTRQQSAFYSIIEQFQEASGSMQAMANSAGALDDAYSTYLDSTTAHINQFKAAYQELSANVFNSDFLSILVDVGKTFVEFANAVVKTKTSLLALGGALAVTKFVKHTKAVAASTAQVKSLTAQLAIEKRVTSETAISVAALNKEELKRVKTNLKAKVSQGALGAEEEKEILRQMALITSEEALEAENGKLALSFKAVTAAIPLWGVFLIALTGIVAAIGSVSKKAQEMREAFAENTQALGDQISTLEEYKKRVEEIAQSEDDLSTKLGSLDEINQDLADGYGIRIQNIKDETEYVNLLNNAIEQEIKNKKQLYSQDNKATYDEVNKKSKDFNTVSGGGDAFKNAIKVSFGYDDDIRKLQYNSHELFGIGLDYGNFDTKSISKEILSMFDYDAKTNEMFIGKNAENEKELLSIMEEAYLKFGKIKKLREAAGNDLTKQEEQLYNALQRNYQDLTEHLGEGELNYQNNIEYAKNEAELLMLTFTKGTKSWEEWKEVLIQAAGGDELVIEQLNELINALKETEEATQVDGLSHLNDMLTELEGKLDSVKESLSTANDYFKDLAKVIDNNADTDKFFSADEMIDMLDKYPELADNILVTAYGYKFETEALEELRQAKLAEQQTAIATQISEAKGARDAAAQELETYTAKLRGISTLAEAEIALAEVEDQLSSGKFAKGGYIANQLEEKRANLAGAIEAWKRMSDADKNIEKAEMQYTILGTVFDDLKDSTNDATAALNNQKSALNDLKDEYKDAQDAIEDLIKLTMDMII